MKKTVESIDMAWNQTVKYQKKWSIGQSTKERPYRGGEVSDGVDGVRKSKGRRSTGHLEE